MGAGEGVRDQGCRDRNKGEDAGGEVRLFLDWAAVILALSKIKLKPHPLCPRIHGTIVI